MPFACSSHVRAKRLKKCRLRVIRQEYQARCKEQGKKKKSLEDICSRLDITKSALAGYERCERLPNVLVCADFCYLFGVVLEDIYPR